MPNDDDLLTSVEAANALGIERSYFLRMVRAEKIRPAHKIRGVTGAYLFSRTDVEALRDQRATA